jgi:hypothetical protein
MGKSLEQLFSESADRKTGTVVVTIVSNQTRDGFGGSATYASGYLRYSPQRTEGQGKFKVLISASFSDRAPLEYLFSDRTLNIDEPGGFNQRQKFSANEPDKLGFFVYNNLAGSPVITFKLYSNGNQTFDVSMEARGSFLVGIGPFISGKPAQVDQENQAVYVVSFSDFILEPP